MMTGSNIYQNNPRYSETPKAITISSFIGYKTIYSGREARSISLKLWDARASKQRRNGSAATAFNQQCAQRNLKAVAALPF